MVRAGRLWDGHGPEIRTDVDILIEDGKDRLRHAARRQAAAGRCEAGGRLAA